MPKGSLNVSLKGADDIFSTEESRQEQQREQVQQIPIGELFPFKNHPFKVLDDESMQRTVESVEQYGVLSPLIARPRPEGGYEIISGHRRQHAAQLAGLDTLPVIVRNMDDDAAVLLMVDSNLQRENILPSERAFAYKMKLEAIERTVGRPKNVGQVVPDYFGKRSTEVVAEGTGESYKQIQRFIRLTNLVPELLDMVDEKKIAFNPAVELSYLDESQQRDFLEAMNDTQNAPSLSQAQRLKKLVQEGHFSYDVAFAVMGEEKKGRAGQGGHQKRHPAEILSPQLHPETDGGRHHQAAGTVAAQTAAAERTLTYTVTKDPMRSFSFAIKRRKAYEKQRYLYHPLRENHH
ncbi:ParB/RepB/Spo0J family partition protein [Faecalibacterium duncaniae]|uniref:ParB/RepB/Spo0J family partition protein n=1 Tax=Faecalibacterium duncaniae (strain DSM 17677 / JCM 31915 / A2-165) TaxID=411483 RepID=UPI003ED8749E